MCAVYFQLKFKRQILNCNLKKRKNPESLLSVNTDLAHLSSLLLRGILAHTCFPICTQDGKCQRGKCFQQRKKQDEVCLCENVHIKDSFHSFLFKYKAVQRRFRSNSKCWMWNFQTLEPFTVCIPKCPCARHKNPELPSKGFIVVWMCMNVRKRHRKKHACCIECSECSYREKKKHYVKTSPFTIYNQSWCIFGKRL